MIVLDACVLIAHLNATDAHHDRATRLLADTGTVLLAASVLTIGEVLVGPVRTGRGEHAQAALDRLGVTELELPAGSALPLAALRAETKLRMPDCCVLLSAENNNAELATFDDQLAKVASSRGVVVRTD